MTVFTKCKDVTPFSSWGGGLTTDNEKSQENVTGAQCIMGCPRLVSITFHS